MAVMRELEGWPQPADTAAGQAGATRAVGVRNRQLAEHQPAPEPARGPAHPFADAAHNDNPCTVTPEYQASFSWHEETFQS